MKKSLPAFFLSAICLLIFGANVFSAEKEGSTVSTHHCLVPLNQIQLKGVWQARYMAATCNLLTRTDRYTIDSFIANASGKPGALWWDWPGDQFGRWFSVLNVAEGLGWTEAAKHRKAVAEAILPCQKPEGYFGLPNSLESNDNRIPSGNAFALRGLVDAYVDTNDPRYLEAARKLAQYFEKIAPQWQNMANGKLHEFYGHCIDGLVALYEQGSDRWALEFAEQLGKNYGRTGHTHHALSLCRGLVDLARVTGKKEYLDSAEDYLAWCRENQTASGGLPECMPKSPQDEGCALADWIVVNLMMFQLAGDKKYLDEAEHMLVNHFFMNQFHTGGFGHRSLSQPIVGGKKWQGWDGKFGSENAGCCSLWGQWALGQAAKYIVTETKGEVCVNLYPTAEIDLPSPGVRLEITSDFPRMKQAQICVIAEKPQTFTLALRVPRWAPDMQVQCEGQPVAKLNSEGRICLSRIWQGTTTIDIRFVSSPCMVEWPKNKSQGVAIFDGPLCLGLSASKADVKRPWTVLIDSDGKMVLDDQKRPQVVDSSRSKTHALVPINSNWLSPDAQDPKPWRILFSKP